MVNIKFLKNLLPFREKTASLSVAHHQFITREIFSQDFSGRLSTFWRNAQKCPRG